MVAEPDPDWDETVDVLCVGAGAGALAYGILCDARGLDVLIVGSGDFDPQTRDYHLAMTEDLDGSPPEPQLTITRATPILPGPVGGDSTPEPKPLPLEPFVGEQLREWSARCLASPFGVMFTEVPDLTPMRTAEGQIITAGTIGDYRCVDGPPGPALQHRLREQADGLFGPAEDKLAGLIAADGRIAGAVLHTADGPWRVGATRGLAFSVGAAPRPWPAQPELVGMSAEVALVGRRAGRFGRVELLAS